MVKPLEPIFKFCQWSWEPMPFECSDVKKKSAINFFESSSKFSARAFQVCILVHYLSLVIKSAKLAKEATEAYKIIGLAVGYSSTAVLTAFTCLLVLKLIAVALARFKCDKKKTVGVDERKDNIVDQRDEQKRDQQINSSSSLSSSSSSSSSSSTSSSTNTSAPLDKKPTVHLCTRCKEPLSDSIEIVPSSRRLVVTTHEVHADDPSPREGISSSTSVPGNSKTK